MRHWRCENVSVPLGELFKWQHDALQVLVQTLVGFWRVQGHSMHLSNASSLLPRRHRPSCKKNAVEFGLGDGPMGVGRNTHSDGAFHRPPPWPSPKRFRGGGCWKGHHLLRNRPGEGTRCRSDFVPYLFRFIGPLGRANGVLSHLRGTERQNSCCSGVGHFRKLFISKDLWIGHREGRGEFCRRESFCRRGATKRPVSLGVVG